MQGWIKIQQLNNNFGLLKKIKINKVIKQNQMTF